MRCPRCNRPGFQPYALCAECGFGGAPAPVEELDHIAYLLGELETWREIPDAARIRARYLDRRKELEIDLGLRSPPLSREEARKLRWELFCLGQLRGEVARWQARGWVRSAPAQRLRQGTGKRVDALRKRLAEAEAPPAPRFESAPDQLKLLDYLDGMSSLLHERGHFGDEASYIAVQADLGSRRQRLEVKAGLRPPPHPTPTPAPVEKAPPPPPRPPREPITWDRIWQTLLSERTLNVLLFLGAFLLMASASTYVVYNWDKLSPAVQLAFILLFTLAFYGAGWFLRVRMGLRASGVAVTAVGSLLAPLDFYAVFVAGGALPPEQWPWVWLAASAVCLPIYTFTAWRVQAELFGYLAAVAAGNLLCAALYVVGAPSEWFLAALAALALALASLAYRLTPPPNAWSILAKPLRFSALIAAAVILPLGVGWQLVGGASGFDFDASLALAWTLGAVLYAYAAIREKSPLLGRAAATALPAALFLLLRLAFEPLGVAPPWYALGWAALAPIYLWLGRRADTGAGDDAVLHAHSHTAVGWGLALMIVAAFWSLFDRQSPTLFAGWAAAATHALLVFGVALAIRLWDRPRTLPIASLLAFSATTFALAAAHLEPAELCLGWALLAVLHILAALRLRARPDYAARLFAAALVLALLALLPPLALAHEPLLTYVLGQWLVLVAWLVWLDHGGEQPGLAALLERLGPLRRSALHWAITLALPFFAAMLYTRFRAPDGRLGLALALLDWGCFGVGRLGIGERRIRESGIWNRAFPWLVVGYASSLAAPSLAFYFYDQALLAATVLLASALYFASAWAFRADQWLIPGGLALPLGLLILLDFWAAPWVQQSVVLALVVAAYLLGGVWLERRRGVARDFMASLYAVAHLVALAALFWGLSPIPERIFSDLRWPDSARLWAAGGQLILGLAYGLFAWFHGQERWAHVAAWLGVLAGGLVAAAYSQGRGSSAFKAALLAAAYVLAERALASDRLRRRWPPAERAWPLYRRALLVAGWAVSVGAIGLALVRNPALLGGGYTREAWAIAGLLAVTALYAASAWLFKRRLFVWLAGALVIVPWTMLTLWGWFLWAAPPPLLRYALAWAVLACLQLALGIFLSPGRKAGYGNPASNPDAPIPDPRFPDHGFPLRVIANLLLPFALFWAVADAATSVLTWGLGLAFYVASAAAEQRRGLTGWRAARFLYPAVAVGPVWAIYLLNHFRPAAPYETYGLLLLALALPLLAVGRRLRVDPAAALPLYLGAYGVAIVGTLLVAHVPPLLALALTFDALLCVLSAWLFREPLWGYPAAALVPAALLVTLAQSQTVPPERRGWWLIGLGAVYVALAWRLRRVGRRRAEVWAYATPPLAMAFVVVALGLPPSSQDDVGAFWGYLAAAGIYALVAAWLRQPLLLTPAAGLLAVPYGVALVHLDLNPAHYGLAIFPGVIAALAVAHLLDWRLGRPDRAGIPGLLDWWAAPFYAGAYLGALAAVGLSWTESIPLAVALALAALTFLHATWRFRSRAGLLLAGALAQGAALAAIDAWGWLEYPAWAALAFLPVTVVTAGLGLVVEHVRGKGRPLVRQSGNQAIGKSAGRGCFICCGRWMWWGGRRLR